MKQRLFTRWIAAGLLLLGCSEARDAAPRAELARGALGRELGEWFDLSGTLTVDGAPLPGATIELVYNGGREATASVVTDANGHYLFDSFPSDTYHLRLVPPAGSNIPVQVEEYIELDADTVRDFDAVGSTVQLRGVVRGHGGAAVAGLEISANHSALIPPRVTQTSATGSYALDLVPGHWSIGVYEFVGDLAYRMRSYRYNLESISEAGVLDIDLNEVQVRGRVLDASGNPITGARISVNATGSSDDGWVSTTSQALFSDANGQYELLAVAGELTFSITASGGAVLYYQELITQDAVRDFTLLSSRIQGTVRGYAGAAVALAQLSVHDSQTKRLLVAVSTDEAGSFELNLAGGQYDIAIRRTTEQQSVEAPADFSYRFNGLVVAGDRRWDLDLPIVVFSGQVSDPSGSPLPGFTVTAVSEYRASDGSQERASSSSVVTESTGDYRVLVMQGSARITLTPSQSSIDGPHSVDVDASADHTLNLTPPRFQLSGTVRGPGGVAVPNVEVNAGIVWTTTDAAGHYALSVGPRRFELFLLKHSQSEVVPSFQLRRSVEITADTTVDFDVPVIRMHGRVLDANYVPIPGMLVAAYADDFQSFSYYATADASGTYEILATGATTLTVEPSLPLESSFGPAKHSQLPQQDGGELPDLVLPHVDRSIPAITAGPNLLYASDTSVTIGWQTNRPAVSRVDYGVNVTDTWTRDDELTTDHSITLAELQPNTRYGYSVDAQGNGSGSSAVPQFEFQTLAAPGDLTAPVFSGPLQVVTVNETSAVLAWATDEPSQGKLEYGVSDALGSEVEATSRAFRFKHSRTITGLSPSTRYFARVGALDPDGNGPTLSALVEFDTAAAPDTQAPGCVSGPMAEAVGEHALRVTWTTDEPASSGVSFNDGEKFDLTQAPELTIEHSILLTGLTWDTTYELTVASSDLSGNHSVCGPIIASTPPPHDPIPPVICCLSIGEVTESSALVSWQTDEPTTTVLHGPQGVLHDPALVLQHAMRVTGLNPDTSYSVMAFGADEAGNEAVGVAAVITTTTGDDDHDNVPNSYDNCRAAPNPDQADRDQDGIGDACDTCSAGGSRFSDLDRDGLPNSCDPCPRDSANDADADGICGDKDNCPSVSNAAQADSDRDGFGDACDRCPTQRPRGRDRDRDGCTDPRR